MIRIYLTNAYAIKIPCYISSFYAAVVSYFVYFLSFLAHYVINESFLGCTFVCIIG